MAAWSHVVKAEKNEDPGTVDIGVCGCKFPEKDGVTCDAQTH